MIHHFGSISAVNIATAAHIPFAYDDGYLHTISADDCANSSTLETETFYLAFSPSDDSVFFGIQLNHGNSSSHKNAIEFDSYMVSTLAGQQGIGGSSK